MDTYYDSAEGEQITRARALQELKKHRFDDESIIATFDAEVQPKANGLYDAQAVLRWLGY